MLDSILRFSIAHRFLVLMATLLAAAAGAYSLRRLPIDAVPDITSNQVVINTSTPALSPLEVEKQVTTPIETALSGIAGLEETRSHSWNGFSQITAFFEEDVDPYFARQQVGERLVEARDALPPGAEPTLGGITTGLGDVYMWVVEFAHPGGKGAAAGDGAPGWQSDGSYRTPEGETLRDAFEQATYLRTVQDWIVVPQVKAVKDVADVDEQGGYVKEYEVAPDPVRLASYGLTFKDLTDALERNNSSGGAKYIEHKGDAYIVRVSGRIEDPARIAEVPVAQHGGTPVRVGDVAAVGLGREVRSGAATLNGRETVMGIAQMLVGANSRTVAAAVGEKLAGIKLPPDVRCVEVLSRTKLVDSTIRTVVRNLAEGAALVVVVLFLLLGNVRAALIAAAAIPLSMLVAATGMAKLKISGNLMSLGAIDFGLIVDGAVIIVENCLRVLSERQRALGRPLTRAERLEVVYQASRQVRSATAFGEAIIIIVYLPVLALTGVAGKMFRPMALTVILALAAAFVLSLTFVPAMVALVMGGRVRERENFVLRAARAAYEPVLLAAVRWRAAVVPLAFVLFAASLLLLRAPDENHPDRLGRDFIPKLDEGDLCVIAMRAPSTGLTESVRIQASIEKALLAVPEVQFVASKIGTGDAASDPIPMSDADTFIVMKPRAAWADPGLGKKDLVKKVEEVLDGVPGSTYEYVQPIEDRFNELIAGVRTDVAVEVFGEDFARTLPAAEAVYRIVRGLGGNDVQEPKGLEALPTLQVEVDREACARYGLSVMDVQDLVEVAVGGRGAGVVFEGDRRFQVVVRLPAGMRDDLAALGELPVPLPKPEADAAGPDPSSPATPARAGYVPLSALARINVTSGPREIVHGNGKRSVVVTFNVRGRDIGSFVADAQRRVQREVVPSLPAGNSIEWGGQFRAMNETWQRLGVIVPLGLFLILMLLYGTFGSARDAVTVFSCVPLALVGGIVALWLRRADMNLSISAGVGFIALSGVAVLNGLVMVSFINHLRADGLSADEAVRLGPLTRLRPVLMTALVASLGFVPMALATGPGAEVQKPLATVVIGGIVSSTVLTLLVLPALYRLLHTGTRVPPPVAA